ncbi:hypothetical protein HPG69_009049 [Diceros bicornis minor]|uniref:Uncharacterized protein n=1 Tax=Diceros bicornis minor TaxID=77932 RepID=A0A7J7EBH8_DICBM|nr:hypothetical protein HPG69_009049 [Diceros bicornis minor]
MLFFPHDSHLRLVKSTGVMAPQSPHLWSNQCQPELWKGIWPVLRTSCPRDRRVVSGPAEGMMLQKVRPPSQQESRYQLSLSHKTAKKVSEPAGVHWLPEPEGNSLWHMLPFLWSALHILTEALHWACFSTQATGYVLLSTSCYMQQVLHATEEGQPSKGKASSLIQTCLKILQ